MSYEDAPATALVATSCCVCGRPLLEAESIASGIGPICAEKTGFGRPGLAPEVRAEVNHLVYELAALQRCPEAVPRVARLRELGMDHLADRIEQHLGERLTKVDIELTLLDDDRWLALRLPWLEPQDFNRVLADLRRVPGWHIRTGEKKRSLLPNNRVSILAVHRVLAKHFAGRPARSPKGLFIVPTPDELEARLHRSAPAAA